MRPPITRNGDSLETCRRNCASLERYWAYSGYEIKATPKRVEVPFHPKDFYYVIKSNLVNGMPEGYKETAPIPV